MTSRSEDVKTPLGRHAWTDTLFVAKSQEEGKEAKFGHTMLFPKTTDISVLHNAALEAAVAEWGDKAAQFIKDGVVRSPFLDGDGPQGINKKTGERNDGYAGCTFIRTTSGPKFQPLVVGADPRIPIVDVKGCPPGCYGYSVVHAFAWEHPKSGKGISFGISLVQVTDKGERLGGTAGPTPEKYFEKIADTGAAPEETKTGKGAGGLFG